MSSAPNGSRVVHVGASTGYDVVIGHELLDNVGKMVRNLDLPLDDACLLVADAHVMPLYGDAVQKSLESCGFTVARHTMPAGEANKTVSTLVDVVRSAATARLTRSSTVVALGGGITGDVAGLAASTYMRGCHLVQIATSLLAMVDSSVGGKTAVDLPEGKNLFGTFYQPDLVVCDLDSLATLDPVFLRDGMGEVVKYALLSDESLLAEIERPGFEPDASIVERCVDIKRGIVELDERESGVRKLLNLGHTIGHAIELCSGYTVPHGHAVAAGACIVARSCTALGFCDAGVSERLESLVVSLGLPTTSSVAPTDLAQAALLDKKRAGDAIDIVVVKAIGRCEVERVPVGDLLRFIALGCDGATGPAAEEGPRITSEGDVLS